MKKKKTYQDLLKSKHWSKTPPTYKEWRGSGGWWFVAFQIYPGEKGWDHAVLIDIVQVLSTWGSGKLLQGDGELSASGKLLTIKSLSSKKDTKNLLWQKVPHPKDNIS